MNTNRLRPWVGVGLAVLLAACGPTLQSHVRDDWATVDRAQVRRVSVVATPVAGDPAQGLLWALVARRYVNQHRDFVVRGHGTAAQFDLAAQCTATAASGGLPFEGTLHLTPHLQHAGDEAAVTVDARLLRCRDGEAVWTGRAQGSYATTDAELQELTAHYVRELGEPARPLVAPVFRVLRALLDTLPQPVLDDELQVEKIELGE